jgi:hypothetical protein
MVVLGSTVTTFDLASSRIRFAWPSSFAGDEEAYLMVINSALFDFDLDLGDDYQRVLAGGVEAGRHFAGQRFEHHTVLVDNDSGAVRSWFDVFDPRRPCAEASCTEPFYRLRNAPPGFQHYRERPAHQPLMPAIVATVLMPARVAGVLSKQDVERATPMVIALFVVACLWMTFFALRSAGVREPWALLGSALLATSALLPYAKSYYPEAIVACAMSGALYSAQRTRPVRTAAWLAVTCAIRPLFALVAAVWALYLFVRWARAAWLRFVVALAVFGVVVVAGNYVQSRTFVLTGAFGWVTRDPWTGLTSALVGDVTGVVRFVPWTALALVAAMAWLLRARSQPPVALVLAAVSVFAVLVPLSFYAGAGGEAPSGDCYGPRYLVGVLPALAIVLAGFAGGLHRWQRTAAVLVVTLAIVSGREAITASLRYRDGAVWREPPGTGWRDIQCGLRQATITQFAAILQPEQTAVRVSRGATIRVRTQLTNGGIETWYACSSSMPKSVHASYHLLDASGAELVRDGVRTDLPASVPPGRSTTVNVEIVAPREPGDYVATLDLVQEGVAWFSSRGTITPRVTLHVE